MFRLREEHLKAFSDDFGDRLPDRIAGFLRREFPDAAAEDRRELVAAVADQIVRAKGYHLESDRDFAVYVTAAWMLGADFDREFPAAQAVLSSDRLIRAEKREWLMEFVAELFSRLERPV